jgi:hypothetical protein
MKKETLLIVFISISTLLISCAVKIGRSTGDGKIEEISRVEIQRQQKDVEREEVDELPEYIIIDQVELISGGIHGDILVTSFSKDTSINLCESVVKSIAKKEGFTEASLYCTREAYQANFSSSYAEAHPNALKEGYLGHLKEDKFTRPR